MRVLALRIVSSLVLAPVALAAAWTGSWAFVTLVAVAVVLLAWEWTRLCMGRFGPGGVALAISAALAAILGKLEPVFAFVVIVLAAVLAPLAQRRADRSFLWLAAGAVYISVPAVALVWIRGEGRETLIWLLLSVWATDIGAYAAGRSIGGPKLMPRVSPRKTWAGLLGGMVSAALVGAGVSLALEGEGPGWPLLAATSAALAVVAQGGDLAESWVKRYFGVKDSSGIIPGHGGVMDRVDGLLAAAPLAALLCLLSGGGLPRW